MKMQQRALKISERVIVWVLPLRLSFAWTPCVEPALASVLLMASSSATVAEGFALIGVYTLGFAIPFLAVGLFRKHRNLALHRKNRWSRHDTDGI